MTDYLRYSELEKDLTPGSKVFYTNGCSMTYGQELVGVSKYNSIDTDIDELPANFHHERLKRCYAGIMHKNLFKHHLFYNAAAGGSSNERIFRSTVFDIGSMIEKGVDPKNIFVSIMFTSATRMSLFDRNLGIWVDVFLGIEYPKEQDYYNQLTDIHLKNFGTTYSLMEESLLTVIKMQSFLKSLGIKYVFSEGISLMTKHVTPMPDIDSHVGYRMIDKQRWAMFEPNELAKGYGIWCKNFGTWSAMKGYPMGIGHHPLEDAHVAWGNLMTEFLVSRREIFL